ncbi:MAG TPA: class I SAM-dependent methyltransferase [Anaerolineales bacterium]|nr:class I SAM-dependent methyltransferase [Anaerolineales bacterium]
MRERLLSFITKQFGNPSGLFGRFIGNGMARRNVYDAQWTISLLDIQPHQRVLEIGFGPGVSTQIASEKASKGFVAGIDHSKTMVQAASQRNADAIQSGRMELKYGDVASLPYPEGSFDIAYSLHSIYFWQKPLECLKEIKRVLTPGGLLAITIQPKDQWKQNVDATVMTLYFGTDLASLFSEAGYQNVHVVVPPPEDNVFLECILGVTRP